MSRTYTKLFSSITESTVWGEPLATRICWIAMLAMADRYGRVFASVPGLANRARIRVEETRAALDRFLGPDPDSRTPDHEGRRIEKIADGWRLLNHAKYRDMRDDEARAAQNREAQERYRSKQRQQSKPEVSKGKRPSAQASPSPTSSPRSNPSAGLAPACADFEQVWGALPKRAGNNPRARALRAFRARLAAGVSLQDILAGAQRYRRWCEASGKDGTEYVMQASTFLGPEQPYLQAWTVAVAGGPSWWATPDAILAKAQELGISTRGESEEALKAQINERIKVNGNGPASRLATSIGGRP